MNGYTVFARYYDLLTANIDYAARARYFDSVIRRHVNTAGLLLDLACGTGSLSLEMAALGYDVIGADASRDMLSVAMQKATASLYDILFLCQEMEKLDLYGTVDVCICALDSLNHLPNEAALGRVLDRIALFLAPGGVFVFDVNTAFKHREVLADSTFVYDLDEVYCVWQNTLLPYGDAVEISLDFFERTGKNTYSRHSEVFREIIFPPLLMERELDKRGLSLLNLYGDDSFDPPGDSAQRLVYVAGKQSKI